LVLLVDNAGEAEDMEKRIEIPVEIADHHDSPDSRPVVLYLCGSRPGCCR
jgi:hypothetical protein